jgi:hypothetical protein
MLIHFVSSRVRTRHSTGINGKHPYKRSTVMKVTFLLLPSNLIRCTSARPKSKDPEKYELDPVEVDVPRTQPSKIEPAYDIQLISSP